jgi:hypothetical protein
MKPNLTNISNKRRTFPQTDYGYSATNVADFRSACVKSATGLRSFRKISEDYFKHEAPPSFVGEAAIFGLIALTASLPIFQAATGLAHFLRAVA